MLDKNSFLDYNDRSKRRGETMNVSILDYGAVADGVTMNTKAIQNAISDVAAAGGGRVSIPCGTFVSGTIYMEDHIELHLEAGAVLLASPDFADYNPDDAYPENRSSVVEQWRGKHLIIAYQKEDFSITGPGTINGNGELFYEEIAHLPKTLRYMWCFGGIRKAKDKEQGRPGQLLAIIDCKNLRFSDFNMKNYPCWGLFLRGCENVQVRGLKIKNASTCANTDGIDIDSSRFVTVSDCIIDTGDDAITLRCAASTDPEKKNICEYVTVTNCILSCSACAVRVGVGTGIIRYATFSNLVVPRAGTALEIMTAYKKSGNANISFLRFENIVAENVSFPLRLTQWNDSYIRDVTVSSFSAKARCCSAFEAEKDGMISRIFVRDMSVEQIPSDIPLDEIALVEKGDYVFCGHGAKDLTFENVRCRIPEEVSSNWSGIADFSKCSNVTTFRCDF